MTAIKASCPGCGEVEMTNADIKLMVASHAPMSYYEFDCPRCSQIVQKPADDHVVALLVSGGVAAQVWTIPAEALEPKKGHPLTYDELLDFALELGQTDELVSILIGASA